MSQDSSTRELAPAQYALPGVNALIRVSVGVSTDLDAGWLVENVISRVEDVTPGTTGRKGRPAQVVIATPSFAGDTTLPDEGQACLITWATERGLIELPARFTRLVRLGAVSGWLLTATGPATRVQRRAFVRVAVAIPVSVEVIEWPPDDELDLPKLPHRVAGIGVDLSEGGVRCRLDGPNLPPDTLVRVHLHLDDQRLTLNARVIRVIEPARASTGHSETAIGFLDPERHGDQLRPVVFAEQMKARRAGLV